jgi:hypothetical protein
LYGIFILKHIMKNIINEELGRMKNLFGYERGRVISEQDNFTNAEMDDSADDGKTPVTPAKQPAPVAPAAETPNAGGTPGIGTPEQESPQLMRNDGKKQTNVTPVAPETPVTPPVAPVTPPVAPLTPPVGGESILKIPGDKTWEYKFENNKWFARKNPKWSDISANATAVNTLTKQFPNVGKK